MRTCASYRALLGVALVVTCGGAFAQPEPPPGDAGVPPIEDVRDPQPPPAGVVDDDTDGPTDADVADAFDDTGAMDDDDVAFDDDARDDDTRDGEDTYGDDDDLWGEEGWDDDVPPLATVQTQRGARKAFIHPTLPPVADRESWSVAAGIQLSDSLATTLVVEGRPFSDLWLMARAQAGAEQANQESTSITVGPPAFSNTVDTSALSLSATAGLGARYGFRFADRVEVSPMAWVRGGITGRRSETATNTNNGNDPLNPNEPAISTSGNIGFFASSSLGATAEVFLIDNLSLRLSADVVEGYVRSDGGSMASGNTQNVLTDLSSSTIGLRVLPRAGFSLRILF